MSRTKHHRNQRAARQGVDLWKPRPLAGASKTTDNLQRERKLMRHRAKAEAKQATVSEATKPLPSPAPPKCSP